MKTDFISAATFPVKLLHNPVVQNGKIIPYHITMIPTNVCNKSCGECFCYKRDTKKELPISEIEKIVDRFSELGTKAISLSGGGEPDCHPHINEIINYMHNKVNRMDAALVTNGKNLYRVRDDVLNKLMWIRVSGTTSNPIDLEQLEKDMERGVNTDWGLSYILGKEDNFKSLMSAINFTNEHDITHLRVVSNMKQPEYNYIAKAKMVSRTFGLDDKKVIWHERLTNEQGSKKCLVPLLHPIVDADGNMQPCCGIHFATNPPIYDFGEKTAICNWKDYEDYLEKQKRYNGTNCEICQYADYNRVLEMLIQKPEHRRFI